MYPNEQEQTQQPPLEWTLPMFVQTCQVTSGLAQKGRQTKKQVEFQLQKYMNDFSNVFTGSGYFNGTFKLQVREDSFP